LNKCNDALVPTRRTSGARLIDFASEVSGIAADVANRTASKLSPIMSEPMPPEKSKDEVKPTIPPFFEELWQLLSSIQGSIHLINNCLDRTDI
jgi:hypothetical protein